MYMNNIQKTIFVRIYRKKVSYSDEFLTSWTLVTIDAPRFIEQ